MNHLVGRLAGSVPPGQWGSFENHTQQRLLPQANVCRPEKRTYNAALRLWVRVCSCSPTTFGSTSRIEGLPIVYVKSWRINYNRRCFPTPMTETVMVLTHFCRSRSTCLSGASNLTAAGFARLYDIRQRMLPERL